MLVNEMWVKCLILFTWFYEIPEGKQDIIVEFIWNLISYSIVQIKA